ncbi:hypothetical protein PSPTOT1_1092 [Pseudomonas syringae pv. tomato T1]|nr:hypothetical protein PSPTOT1_1092 [Pseudomonas syringae pv. tomato T1]
MRSALQIVASTLDDGSGSDPETQSAKQKKTRKSSFSWAFQIFEMVGRVGFEPTTNWLKANWFHTLSRGRTS